MDATCSEPTCDSAIWARQMCKLHYGRWYRQQKRDGAFEAASAGTVEHRMVTFDLSRMSGVCARCGSVRISVKTRGDGRSRIVCRRAINEQQKRRRARRQPVPARVVKASQPGRKRRWYYLRPEDKARLVARQGGACAICGRVPAKGLVVDHCHTTGVVRGMLCDRCNFALGWLDDDARRVLRAHAYLVRSNGAMLPPIG